MGYCVKEGARSRVAAADVADAATTATRPAATAADPGNSAAATAGSATAARATRYAAATAAGTAATTGTTRDTAATTARSAGPGGAPGRGFGRARRSGRSGRCRRRRRCRRSRGGGAAGRLIAAAATSDAHDKQGAATENRERCLGFSSHKGSHSPSTSQVTRVSGIGSHTPFSDAKTGDTEPRVPFGFALDRRRNQPFCGRQDGSRPSRASSFACVSI